MLSHLYDWIRGDFARLAAGALLAAGAAAMALLTPGMVGQLQDAIGNGESPVPALSKVCGLVLGRFALEYAATSVITYSCQNVADRMRLQLFHSLIRADIAFFDASRTGRLSKHLDSDVKEIRDALRDIAGSGVGALTSTVGGLATLVWISPLLAGGLMALMVPLVVTGNAFGGWMRHLAAESSDASAASAGVATESLANVRVVRSFNAEDIEEQRYREALAAASERSRAVGQAISFFKGGVTLALNGLMAAVLAGGGLMVERKQLTQGEVASFLFHTLRLSQAVESVSVLVNKANRALGAATRLSQMLDTTPEANRAGGVVPASGEVDGDIEWHDVGFAYPSRPGVKVLNGLSLRVAKGSTVALVGASGAGKSTAGQLLFRFYEPDTGSVTVDGHSLGDMDAAWYRNHVAVVPQHPVLFAASVRDNIRYGKPDATDDEVSEALRAAQCDFVFALPEGLDTQLAEGGGSLSGGQRQRLNIARALVRQPKILLLDEATASLDSESESKVQSALEEACRERKRTVVVIAHRLSTVRMADSIAVLSGGRVVEQGTHTELLARDGAYAALVKQQQEPTTQDDASVRL
jgi:ABC-type multidrug transport system fused ATPase/permease subunit